MPRRSVFCPVDFSDASRGALRYAAAIAEHFYATLTVAMVDDPLLSDAATITYGEGTLETRTRQEKGICPRTGCPHDLRDTAARLEQAIVRESGVQP